MNKEQWAKGIPNAAPPVPPRPVLFTVEILFQPFYNGKGERSTDIERWYIHNQGWFEISSLRERIFTHGFFLERSPGRGEIIFPRDFRKILIDIQKDGFKE